MRYSVLVYLALCMSVTPADDQLLIEPLTDQETWARLPELETGAQRALPTWARMLARALPTTTAAMLEFDAIHRLRSPLEPKQRARVRATVALTNQCTPTFLSALGDLERVGGQKGELDAWRAKKPAYESLSEIDRSMIDFAIQLTKRGADIDDEQFARLRSALGDASMVALVQLIAGANFQDRLFLALHVPIDATTSQPPLDVRFKTLAAKQAAAPRPTPNGQGPKEHWQPSERLDPKWGSVALTKLRDQMADSKERKPRVTIPSADEYVRATKGVTSRVARPAGKKSARKAPGVAPRVVWTLVCSGFQPELAQAWSHNTGSFRLDAKQDRVFEESLFWIVTRSIDCFY